MTARAARAALPWRRVHVAGPSMAPTLRDGDVLLVRHGAAIRPGDVVLARFRDLPGRLVVKRAEHEADGGWWLRSDNEFVEGDSRSHGVADVDARAVLVWDADRPRRRRWVPRRVR